MKKYRLVDNICGWVAFLIAAFVYCSTVEPTASFWDCPEFIATGYKLEVGHPPGAPFFMLAANLFSQFASDPTDVAFMVNIMNALLSALCILFLFWTITHLARRLILKDWESLTNSKLIAIEASGMVGALIYTFSDTFWFSAVEGEVYAFSSAFTAVVFWLILKWEDHADEPHSDRWLVLIAYMTGLSIGVHLLNLLCIPAIVLVFYYKKNPNANLKGSLLALGVSALIVWAVLYGVVPGIITVGGWFELFFVNTLHMSFNTGLIVYIIVLVSVVIWAIYESYTDKSLNRQNVSFLLSIALLGIPFYGYGWSAFFIGVFVLACIAALIWYKKNGKTLVSARIKNTVTLCMLMLMIGYSTYAVIVIRSSANPPMDQNSPEDIFTLGSYLSRDQYGDRPLLFGQAYNSEVKYNSEGFAEYNDGAPIWQRKEKASPDEPDQYVVVYTKKTLKYAQNMFFPRMYSDNPLHISSYEEWMGGIEGTLVPSELPGDYKYNTDGTLKMVKMPTFLENMGFFLSYQCNWMYWRYFLWNFAGRQNDIQGNGELTHGNWLTGIPFIDNARLGDQDTLPDELKNNKGHNVFYCLPLLLGLIGLFWQSFRGRRGIRQFWVVFFLFFMTGLAIVLYLNQTPQQPRERDYAYAGSFYAYAIWCGLGVVALIDLLKRIKIKGTLAAAAVSGVCMLVPIQMATQTWDDHDRSGRYACRDFGENYLNSLPEQGNPIIFTNGDNDTFPLWYNQDVEGNRTDARVCNLSYLQTDWYIDQMKRPAYDSPSLPISWPRLDYCTGSNESCDIAPAVKTLIESLYKSDPEGAREMFGDNPFELKNILKIWVRNAGTPEQKAFLDGLKKKYELPKNYIPTDTVYITVDKDAVRRSGMKLPAGNSIPDRMVISLKGQSRLLKNDLMMLEMLAESNWSRPMYIASTVGTDNYRPLAKNIIREGLNFRIVPYTTDGESTIDADKTYDLLMNKYLWGGVDNQDADLYLDQTIYRMCCTHRRLFAETASALIAEGKNDKAAKLLAKMEQAFPDRYMTNDYVSGTADIINAYITIGDEKNAKDKLDKMWKNTSQYLDWYSALPDYRRASEEIECITYCATSIDVPTFFAKTGQKAKAIEAADKLWNNTMWYFDQYMQQGNVSSGYWKFEKYYVRILYGLCTTMEDVDQEWADQHLALFNDYYRRVEMMLFQSQNIDLSSIGTE